ncbi:MAG: transketolase C-terminal domain-containing protein [Phycisphaeraceae bacterium]
MRNAFAQSIEALAAEDDRVVLLSGDIGNRMFDRFKERFPTRFYNCGIAEQSMISMAAGLALCGLRPFAYTIAPFITARCLEQIRVDLCYHELPVVFAGVGAGLGYAELGATHHACEDIAMLRCLPGMTVICPGDAMEVRAALPATLSLQGPAYLRLGKKGEAVVHQEVPKDFAIGRGLVVRDGHDVCLLSTGNTLPIAIEAGTQLASRGVRARVVSFHTVKPLDFALLDEVFARFACVTSIEEHSLIGGLGSAIAEWLVDGPPRRARLLRIGTPDAFPHEAGDQAHAREQIGLTPESIMQRVWQFYMSNTKENVHA